MDILGWTPQLCNCAMHENRCMETINKLYKYYRKCDYQQQNKVIIEVEMVSTPEESTDNSPISPRQSVTVKNPSAKKPPHQFPEALYIKPKAVVCRLCASK